LRQRVKLEKSVSISNEWNYYVGVVAWLDLLFAEFPSWDKEGRLPPEVDLFFTLGEGKQSIDVARAWDDVAAHGFYWEDIGASTDMHGRFWRDGDRYIGRFFFQRKSEAERFEGWLVN